ncbi:unnamed protein product [Ambrosiozyma monospora]|uniref:Unnamed protein product n=1 Tax=Ambrosiozyma monospora TaxID=43982 RepID=A0ACB5SSK4_AMBMO|nr:unnamed protein product [Ambrosiozyma monospora]
MLGADQVIPHEVLLNAKGLAIITVLKAGFLFSGRAGSGVVVARLPDGTWSAPSAIVTAGAGVGGQVGAEVTDFVFILNTESAVKSFAQYGSVTLGGNLSVAAGPLGRNAEVAGSASLKSVAPVFSYSKTKGLFAGVSVEGSVLVERREANRKFYGSQCKAAQVLSGRVAPPPACEPLMRILESRAFSRAGANGEFYSDDEDYYDDIPSQFSDDSPYPTRRNTASSARSAGRVRNNNNYDSQYSDDDSYEDDYYRTSQRHRVPSATERQGGTSWEDDVYDRYDSGSRRNTTSSHKKTASGGYRPKSEKPDFGNSSSSTPATSTSGGGGKNKAIALYSFAGEQSGDLPFKKGDVITIIQKSDSTDDWWTGRVGTKEGIFPANYVELV